MVNGETFSKPEIPPNEQERLEQLYGLKLLDTASDLRFDRYTRLVAQLFEFPIVLVTLIDQDRQWFKSSCGLDFKETSRDLSFCAHAINTRGLMVVPDARQDPRFAGNPLVTGEPYIRFYAGAVVHSPAGQPLGTLCVIDHQPRDFDDTQAWRLRQFADLIENEIAHQCELENLRAAIQFSAYYDPLTSLANRRLLCDRLGQLIALAEREERSVLVLLFNVAGLRLINQSFGSEVGDDLLCQISERLQACCPLGGTVARLQADEFVMCFSAPGGGSGGLDVVAEQTREGLNQPFFSAGREHYVQVQMGGSMFPEHGATAMALIERASAAIRFSAGADPSGVRFFCQEESLDISERLRIESRLRAALNTEHLSLVYQPIVDLGTGWVVGVEALCRWYDPELGEISPGRFVPIAEQSGLVEALGAWVQATACRQIKRWQAEDGFSIPVAINVAPVELQQPDFAIDLLRRLADEEVDTSMLWLEVTERSLVDHTRWLQDNLERLREAGVRISIDDFGTGYSSLSYLGRFPLNGLKIDRSFVGGLPDGSRERALVRSIVGMAEAFHLTTVGEGVETRGQLDELVAQGCQMAQGFFIAHPAPAHAIPSLAERPLIS